MIALDLPKGCSRCNGRPFVEGPDGAARCSCQRGRELLELDHQRRAGAGSPASVAKQRTANRAKSRRDAGKAAANDKEPGLFT